MKAEVLKGHLDGLLLAALEAGPAHGYGIIRALREGSGGRIDLPTGTIYPVLHRLERAGLISGSWSTAEGRPRRIYKLTAAGHRALEGERSAWREFADTLSALLEGKGSRWPTPDPATA
jgi:PadR family transcriptional regulator, regulatory protein PadR